MKQHGGHVLEPNDDGLIPIAQATHIISNSIDFPQYVEAMAMMVPVVQDSWVGHSLARGRQCPIRPYSPDPRLIFSSVVVTSTDEIPESDRQAIAGAVMALGGMESRELAKTTTHVCALTMEDPTCKMVQARALKKVKIVLPHWFDDCFKLGKRIDETPYLLPNPPILTEKSDDDVSIPAVDHLSGATSAHPDYMPPPPPERSARTPLLVFRDKNVYLAPDLGLKDTLRKILKDLIDNGQGRLVDDAEDSDWFICQFRTGQEYVRAAQAGKEIGNLSWLYHLITYNEYSSPFKRLLHYPVPKDGIPGFKYFKITVSNYGGEARIYLENLIRAAGATFTRTMTGQNTHLITARNNSEKCEAAVDWNISMINHLWLEESYAQCEVQALTMPRYTHFPPRTNLGEVIGQTFLEEAKLRATYYPGGEDRLDAKGKRKRKILDDARKNAIAHGPAAGVVPVRRQEPPDFDIMKDTGEGAPKRDKADLATPARIASHQACSEKENETPSILSSGSRSAKANAAARIHGLADDVLLYEKEKKRAVKGGPWGGKRAAAEVDKQLAAARSSPVQAQEGEDDDDESTRPAKRVRPTLPAINYRLCITGWKRWVGNKKLEDADRVSFFVLSTAHAHYMLVLTRDLQRKLRGMGIQIVQEGRPCDYLLAPHMVRTVKFLVTLARGVPVLDSKFLEDCLDQGELENFDNYHLVDEANEKKYNVKLSHAVARAKANKGKLLWNTPIYCTEGINHGHESYKQVAQANGAIFKVYRARSGTTIKPTTAEEDGGDDPDPVYLISSDGADERKLWPKFRKMAEDGHMKPLVVKSDWLLDVAMRQQVFFKKSYLVENAFGKAP